MEFQMNRLFPHVLVLMGLLEIFFWTPSLQMSTMWAHRRHLGNNIIYPDEFLNHLGYLDDGHGFHMHTRAERKQAIRLYQRENGLLQTGKIDKATWQLMKMPRCSVPDRGKMVTGRSPLATADSHRGAIRRKRAAPTMAPKKAIELNDAYSFKWIIPTLKWKPTRLAHTMPIDSQKAIFSEAFRRWSKPSNIVITPTDGDAEIDINFSRREHGDGQKNAFDGPGMLLAHAFPPGDSDISGDMHFDSEERWTVGVNDSESRDLMMIAMHEAGHALGLQHSKKKNDIMYPVYLDYNPNPELSRGDIYKLQKLYGKKPGFNLPPRKYWRQELRRKARGRRFRVDKSLPKICRAKFNAVVLGPDKFGYIFIKRKVYKVNDDGVLPGYPVHVGHEFPQAPINPALVFYIKETDKLYFFKNNRFWRYSFMNRTLDNGYPMKSLSEFWKKPKTALSFRTIYGRSIVNFFAGKYMWRWNYRSEMMIGNYHLTSKFWRGLPHRMDAAVQWHDDFIYFFQQNRYYKMGRTTNTLVKGYPLYKAPAWLGGECGSEPK